VCTRGEDAEMASNINAKEERLRRRRERDRARRQMETPEEREARFVIYFKNPINL